MASEGVPAAEIVGAVLGIEIPVEIDRRDLADHAGEEHLLDRPGGRREAVVEADVDAPAGAALRVEDARHISAVVAIGFSVSTSTPASSAATIRSACVSSRVQTISVWGGSRPASLPCRRRSAFVPIAVRARSSLSEFVSDVPTTRSSAGNWRGALGPRSRRRGGRCRPGRPVASALLPARRTPLRWLGCNQLDTCLQRFLKGEAAAPPSLLGEVDRQADRGWSRKVARSLPPLFASPPSPSTGHQR